jgi:hypothetical protein
MRTLIWSNTFLRAFKRLLKRRVGYDIGANDDYHKDA